MTTQNTVQTFQQILVPLDGSPRAEEALSLAAKLARTSGASLLLLFVILPSDCIPALPVDAAYITDEVRNVVLNNAHEYLKKIARDTLFDGINVQIEVQIGGAPNTIIETGQAHQIDLIVMRSHGETGLKRWLFGSVALQVIRHSPIPVIVVRDGYAPSAIAPDISIHVPRILVALDGSELAEAAILPAAQLAAVLADSAQGTVHLIRAVLRLTPLKSESKEYTEQLNKEVRVDAEAYLKGIEQRFSTGDLAPFHLSVTTAVVAYSDAEEITRRIVEESMCIGDGPGFTGCDIIAMATHGRHGFQHILLGSFTEHVFDTTQQPLLVIHSTHAHVKELSHDAHDEKHAQVHMTGV